MSMRRFATTLMLIGLACAASACALPASGGETASPVESVDAQLAESKNGDIDLQLLARALDGTPVGFRVAGVYDLRAGGPYPLLDLSFVKTPGDGVPVRVISTGEAVFAGTEGAMAKLPSERANALRTGGAAGVTDLGFAGWVKNPRVGTDRQSGAKVTKGDVDVVDFMTDLAQLAARVEGSDQVSELDDDSAQRLEQAVASSRIEVVSDAQTDQLRSLYVKVSFAVEASTKLTEVLGAYAGVEIELLLRYGPLSAPLEVAAPS